MSGGGHLHFPQMTTTHAYFSSFTTTYWLIICATIDIVFMIFRGASGDAICRHRPEHREIVYLAPGTVTAVEYNGLSCDEEYDDEEE